MKKVLLILFLTSFGLTGFSQESYTLTEGSSLAIDGTSTMHDWTVTANTLEGTATVNGESVNAIEFLVAVADISSGRDAAMDKKMYDALKKEQHPKITFTVDAANSAMGANQALKGQLNIAGMEQEVSVPVTISQEEGSLQISGEKKIILKDYEIEPPSAMFGSIVVGDEVVVKFDLLFKKS